MDNMKKEIQWYPGHMAKARRQMMEKIKTVDAVLQVLDSRIPYSSANPDFNEMFANKVRLTVLNKSDMADPAASDKWIAHEKRQGSFAISINATNKGERRKLTDFIIRSLKDKIERNKNRGYKKTLRLMIVGIPNSGKSTIINMLAAKASAKTSNRPGVTRGQQAVRISDDIELVDTPGVLWPKFEDERVGLNLAMTGAIKDDILDRYGLALSLIETLEARYPGTLSARFGVETAQKGADLILEDICKKRGLLMSGGRVDIERGCTMLLTEFRAGKLGRMTLEMPDE
jgi:ribosome biogenesis GTPase A